MSHTAMMICIRRTMLTLVTICVINGAGGIYNIHIKLFNYHIVHRSVSLVKTMVEETITAFYNVPQRSLCACSP